jgi:hypothetical protein
MLQQVFIALIVMAAAAYVVWTFLPMATRQRWLDRLAARGIAARAAAAHRRRLATPGCSNCAGAGDELKPRKG